MAEREPDRAATSDLLFHNGLLGEGGGVCKSRFCKLILFEMPWGACHSGNPRLNSFIN